jgi:hypothetical protein
MRLSPRLLPLVVLALCPPLLAPIYYQGANNPMNPNTEPSAGPVTDLPAAQPLASPLLVTPSAEPADDSSTAPPEAAPAKTPDTRVKKVVDPVTCVKGMDTMQDMAMVAYQHAPNSAYMGVMVAAAMAKQQIIQGQLPNLETVRRRLHALPWGAQLRDQLLQAYVMSEPLCLPADKAGGAVKAKPTVERPR